MALHRKSASSPDPSVWAPFLVFLLLHTISLQPAAASDDEGGGASTLGRKAYIVYLGGLPKGMSIADVEDSHRATLDSLVSSTVQEDDGGAASSTRILHSYKRSFNGFSAMLSEEEAKQIAGYDGVVSVFPSEKYKLHTTKSWDFVGLPLNVARVPTVESDVIVGMIDTGIWPASESFDDAGYGPPPSKWKGTCQTATDFKCNNKVIGARYYNSEGPKDGDVLSPIDTLGHGSHTASTVAGRRVAGADLYGLAKGTARGGVPSARIAVYKVCWVDGCAGDDILKAFDDAIADGVDILSVSLGAPLFEFYKDVIAIGSYHAMKKGILTSNSAGNDGPRPRSVVNVAPWSLTVAASTIDRRFVADVKLGNGMIYEGTAINTFDLGGKMYPLLSEETPPEEVSTASDSLSEKGKIVVFNRAVNGNNVLKAGGAGAISQGAINDYSVSYPLPATFLRFEEGEAVVSYMNETSNPTATISKSSESGDAKAPYVVSFSSRGPNTLMDISKPDLTAPGVDILAAWSPLASMSGSDLDKRKVQYNIISGTSMSCPHATGAAAYVKTFHPAWSPAAIKSALMTTATPMRSSLDPDEELAYGSGQINPLKAVKPGLVYDAGAEDYVRMLCGAGYDTKTLRMITGDDSVCTPGDNGTVWDLNYPSFALSTLPGDQERSFRRTVTNVGSPSSVYRVTVDAPSDLLQVDVEPKILSFKRLQEKQSFTVRANVVGDGIGRRLISASLTWGDGVYQVRSPVIAFDNDRR